MRKSNNLMRLLCLVLCLTLLAAGCGNQGATTSTEGQEVTFSVTLTTEGGMLLADQPVYIYTDDTLEELVWFARTDAQGVMTFNGTIGSTYAVVIQDAPTGYYVEDCYIISEKNSEIVLGADTEAQVNATDFTYGLGDAVYNFSVTTPDGTVYTLYDLLAQYDAVVLNFWYSNCGPCKSEFPYIQAAYEQYGDNIMILAMNPVDGSDEAVSTFQNENGLTFPMVNCDAAWVDAMQLKAYPTTVVIDRYGIICLIHSAAVTEEGVFEGVFQHFVAEDYVQSLISDLSQIAPSGSGGEDETGSSADNPLEMGAVESFEVTLNAGQEMYYHLYKVSQMILAIESADAYVIYKDHTYSPENGVVSLQLDTLDPSEPAAIVIGNSGEGENTFTVTLSNPAGSYGNPYTLELGDFTVELEEGNEQGLYYTYTATESGNLTLQLKSITAGVEAGVVLYNLSSGAYRTLEADGTEEDGVKTLSVAVEPGETVQVIVSTVPDRSFCYPAATIGMTAEMRAKEETGGKEDGDDEPVVEDDITYTFHVVDDDGKAVSKAEITVDAGAKLITLTSDSSGKASVALPADTYEVTLTVPSGYSASATTFRVSKDSPDLTIELVKMAEYSITVMDKDGNAIPGVKLTVGKTSLTTNDSGKASVSLPADTYAVTLTVPSGYSAATTGYQLTADSPKLTIKLAKVNTTVETANYTVKVVDTAKKPISGVTVTVDGTTGYTNDSGVVTFNLPKGSYKAKITLPGGYSSDSTTYDIPASGSLTVTLTKIVKMVDYTVTVLDSDNKPVSGVELTIGTTSVETNKSGEAIANLAAGTYTVTLTVPSGYKAEQTTYELKENSSSWTIRLTKVSTAVETADYKVTVKDAQTGKGVADVTVTVGGVSQTTNSSGVATFTLSKSSSYTATITVPSGYNGSTSVSFGSKNTVTISLVNVSSVQDLDTSTFDVVCVGGVECPLYAIGTGTYNCPLIAGGTSYFEFTPDTSGVYKFTVLSGSATLGYSGSVFFAYEPLEPSSSYSQSIEGGSVVIGVKAAAGTTSATISVVRTGNISKVSTTIYSGTHQPSAEYAVTNDGLVFVDITAPTDTYKLVKDSNGFYRLSSLDGPLVFVDLINGNYKISLSAVLATTGVKAYFDADGNITRNNDHVKIVDYSTCLQSYLDCVDSKLGMCAYPLTDDLMIILKNYGEQQWLWSTQEVNGTEEVGKILEVARKNKEVLNPEIAWMFACCYVG